MAEHVDIPFLKVPGSISARNNHITLPPLHRTISETGSSPPRKARLEVLKNTLLKSHGRRAWYGEDGVPTSDAFVVGIAGGSASGKTHVAQQIVQKLGSIPSVVILSQDSFYRKHSPEEVKLAHANLVDFDHPDAIDMPMFAACLADLKAYKQTNIPIYSFSEHQRLDETKYLYGASIIITEGILALHDESLRNLYDLKVFVQCDSDLMLARRIRRDVKERGRTVDGVLDQYLRYVKPAYDNFVLPTSRYANVIVPGSDNQVAIELIATHISRQLKDRANKFRTQVGMRLASQPNTPLLGYDLSWENFIVLPETPQLKGIQTILRDKTTSREDFIFFVDRLATTLIEKAMEYVPHRPKTVLTPVEVEYHGSEVNANICGVTILRSGGPLERGLQRVINDVPLGCLLIQSEAKTGEPLLLSLQLPPCIKQRHQATNTWVFILDAQIGTGAAAFMAIRVLLDHGVPEDHIIFVAFLVAKNCGIQLMQRAFPKIKVICAAVDDGLHEMWLAPTYEGEGQDDAEARKVWVVEPGMGHIGDRYYL